MSRVPVVAQAKTLVVVAIVTLIMLAAWEWHLRAESLGEQPARPVAVAVDRVRTPAPEGTRRVVFLGSSRAQFGISPTIVQSELGKNWEVRNAALSYGNGFAQLHASLDWFEAGDVIVVECLPFTCFTGYRTELELAFERDARDSGIGPAERLLTAPIKQHLLLARGQTVPSDALRDAVRGGVGVAASVGDPAAESNNITTHPDGWLEYTGGFNHELAAAVLADLTTHTFDDRDARLTRALRTLRDDLQTLNERGVAVLFVRLPSEGEYASQEARQFPRASYWNRLEREAPGRCWHFADFAATRNLTTLDHTHLPSASAKTYSRWLGLKLRQFVESEDR
ncbi:MAG: hypothetical protein KDB32_09785 [Planctomycetes bacterium]|nr:hypothetical protein [Planctomycetota bacterium]